MKSLPFISKITDEAPNGDRAVSDSDVREIIKTVWSNGVALISPDGSDLQVVADNGMSVKVLKGGCIISGAIGRQDKEMTIKVSAAHSSLKRMDRIVARFDLSEQIRSIEIYLKEGTPSTTPVAPNLVQASNYYEIALADIRVKAGATEINNIDILDQRQNPEVCGFVQPAFPTNFDISAITDRYTELLKGAFNGTTAGAIQNDINSIRAELIEAKKELREQIEQVKNIDHVIEQGTKDGWEYRKWKSGKLEQWLSVENDTGWSVIGSAWNGFWWEERTLTFGIPFTEVPIAYGNVERVASGFSTGCTVKPTSTSVKLVTGGSQQGDTAKNLQIYAIGKYK